MQFRYESRQRAESNPNGEKNRRVVLGRAYIRTVEPKFNRFDHLLSWAGRVPVWLSPAHKLTTKPSTEVEGKG